MSALNGGLHNVDLLIIGIINNVLSIGVICTENYDFSLIIHTLKKVFQGSAL